MNLSKVKEYAQYAVERAIETGVSAGVAVLAADQTHLLHANWERVGEVALGAALASLLSSLRAWTASGKKPVDPAPAETPAPVA